MYNAGGTDLNVAVPGTHDGIVFHLFHGAVDQGGMLIIFSHIVHVKGHGSFDVGDFGSVLHIQITGIYTNCGTLIGTGIKVPDFAGSGQGDIRIAAAMNRQACGALPHISVCFDIENIAADGGRTAVHIDSTAHHITDFRTFVHDQLSALKPDCTGCTGFIFGWLGRTLFSISYVRRSDFGTGQHGDMSVCSTVNS